MRAWRICKQKWASSAFSGEGAAENPGRWNYQGQKAVYCAESKALAALEVMANVGRKRTLAKARFIAIPVDIPDDMITSPKRLPRSWSDVPPPARATSLGGNLLLQHPAIRVPSAVVAGEFCYVLNPQHPDFKKLKIGKPESFAFDVRVLTSGDEPSD